MVKNKTKIDEYICVGLLLYLLALIMVVGLH